MKKIGKVVAIVAVVLLIGSIALQKQCDKPLQQVDKNDYLLPSEVYKDPLIKIPFIKTKKQPVRDEDLPILKKDVRTTIVVENPVPGARDITLVIDREGKIYKSKDTPEKARIEVTIWKPRLFDIKPRLGYSGVYSNQYYHCLSLDVLRIGKFYAGGEAGISLSNYGHMDDYLLGVSGKYHFATLDFFGGIRINALATLGYDFLNKIAYVGFTIRW